MSKIEQTETKVATATGFRGGHRVRRGDTFVAPVSEEGKWFTSGGSADEITEALSVNPNVLNMTPTEVKAKAPSMTSQEINEAISAETGSGKRKNVLAILRDELANRVGQIGEPNPTDDLLN